ncbi:hypothetical protein NM208_g2746 [Fusarium decemcellulare]|uniref:Uncharacterized protein n=1 Tax=Fusarium decemcellulare TaxID=57161 RepID=A0ACC1SRD1_9HYPO|nr:hypothetical protein NM208_g2746 [Fusarium decemcellulare]
MYSSTTARLLLLGAAGFAGATLQVVPGASWTATNTGMPIQAHGAAIFKENGIFYWIGEDKSEGTAFQNVNCYSSTNLVEWSFVNTLLSRTMSGDLGPGRIVERPKVLCNNDTDKYVMYLHIDDHTYSDARVGVAVSDSVCGNYTYSTSWRPLGFESRDIGLFKDDDGSAYLLTEDRKNGLRINALTDDYLNVSRKVHLFDRHFESPALLKRDGYYFVFGSNLTGWYPNDNKYAYAKSLSGPWAEWQSFAPEGLRTYNSQTSFILPLGGDDDAFIYLGDRWARENLMRSTYLWLPLEFSGTRVTLKNRVSWVPHVHKASWSPAPQETDYEAEKAVLKGGAFEVPCSKCSGRAYVGGIGGEQKGSVEFYGFNSQNSTRSTLRIVYSNPDSSERFANVTINNVSQIITFLPTRGEDIWNSASVHADFESWVSNPTLIQGVDDGLGPNIDRIFLPNY